MKIEICNYARHPFRKIRWPNFGLRFDRIQSSGTAWRLTVYLWPAILFLTWPMKELKDCRCCQRVHAGKCQADFGL